MTEPRDIEKDKATLDWYDSQTTIPTMNIARYYITQYEEECKKTHSLCVQFNQMIDERNEAITQYEAQQARIAKLERKLQLKQTKSHNQMLAEAFAAVESRTDGGSYD